MGLEDLTMSRSVDLGKALLARLDRAIARGIRAADAGDARPAAEVFARLDAKYRELAEARVDRR
jgi:predicted transcriptional regulator